MNKAVNKLGFSSVNKPQQMMVNEFINGREVFVVLLTCFGKTMCFTCLSMAVICSEELLQMFLLSVALVKDHISHIVTLNCMNFIT